MEVCEKAMPLLKYYTDFSAFTSAIEDGLAHTQTTHKHALSSLLTLNFQSFKKAQSLTMRCRQGYAQARRLRPAQAGAPIGHVNKETRVRDPLSPAGIVHLP